MMNRQQKEVSKDCPVCVFDINKHASRAQTLSQKDKSRDNAGECDTIAMARRVKEDQGKYENEVSFQGMDDLTEFMETCTKNPGHANFIKVDDLEKSHLPPLYQHDVIVDTIKSVADITGLVYVNNTSSNRPETFPDSDYPYPFYHNKESKALRTGSGWIVRVKRRFTEEDNKTCPCPECKPLPSCQRHRIWGHVVFWTAAHLIFDTQEAMNSTILLDYNDTEFETGMKRLTPYKVKYKHIEGDWCWVDCVTHDIGLWEDLKKRYRRSEELQKKADDIFRSGPEDLAAIVSHPHGRSKRISIGSWRWRDDIEYKEDNVETGYTYNTATCPGSSGAPVWVLGRKRRGQFLSHAHSCAFDEKFNRSSVGINY